MSREDGDEIAALMKVAGEDAADLSAAAGDDDSQWGHRVDSNSAKPASHLPC
jgi:hypothetical protein